MMSERTGLGPLETEILLTLERLGATPDGPHRKSANVLREVERVSNIGPRYGYEVLCDLARPWQVSVPLVDGHGNFGALDDPAAAARYTEVRLTGAGALVTAAEQGVMAPVPIDLLNGTLYRGGARPPFAPTCLLDALLALLDEPSLADATVLELVGVPEFPNACGVTGQIAALVAGRPATLHCSARIAPVTGPHHDELRLTNFPPGWSADRVGSNIAQRVNHARSLDEHSDLAQRIDIPVRDVRDESADGQEVLVCELRAGADIREVEHQLRGVWGVEIDIACDVGVPLPVLLRTWVDAHATEKTGDALRRLRRVVVGDR